MLRPSLRGVKQLEAWHFPALGSCRPIPKGETESIFPLEGQPAYSHHLSRAGFAVTGDSSLRISQSSADPGPPPWAAPFKGLDIQLQQ